MGLYVSAPALKMFLYLEAQDSAQLGSAYPTSPPPPECL